MQKSESIKNLATALLKFHSQMGKVSKTAANPFFKSKYAPLTEILDAIQSPLQECGLTFVQMPDGDCLCTILIHSESGEWIEGCYAMHPVKSDPQSIGSAITYARRYALGAILGLNIDEDDDGNKASSPQSKPEAKAQKPLLSAVGYDRLKARISAGESDAIEKAIEAFTLNENQIKELKSLLPK
jgi:hypothetical protein